jgi:uncharacterized protein
MTNYRAFPRPWPAPKRPWIMAQTWNNLLFAHWRVPPESLRLPPGLTLDTYNGEAWVGVVPFYMTNIRLRGLPPIPGTSALPELNVRTYVTCEGKPGVWFYSLDADHPAAVETARRTFHLSYFHTQMSVRRDESGTVHYYARRVDKRANPGTFIARYAPAGSGFVAAPDTLEYWLTARYALYAADSRDRLYRGEIAHAPWVLHPAQAEIFTNTVAQSHGIPLPDQPPLLHFVHRMDMVAWNVERLT